MPRALVFAASSFIGQHLCRALKQHNVEVFQTRRACADGFIACDLTAADSVLSAIQAVQPDWIIQCGAATASRDPRELYQTHVFGTLNVLEAVEKHAPTARVILMGSAAEYGSLPNDWLPLTEDRLPQPSSVFGASKLAQTQLAQAIAAEKKLSIACIRPFNVLGPGLPDIYFAASLSSRLLAAQLNPAAAKQFEVTNASATRDFVDVRDVANACWLLLTQANFEPGQCEIFNIATGQETTLMQLASCLGELAGGFVPIAGGTHQSRGGINRSCGSAAKLAEATGWKPEISWQTSVRDLWRQRIQHPNN